MTSGERIKHGRKISVLTQKQLAELTGIRAETIRQYELGSRSPKIDQIEKIAKGMRLPSFLLDPDNWSYVPLDTKGDLIALLIELLKKGIVGLIPDIVIDQDIVEAVTRWIDMYKVEYLPLRDTSSDKVNQFILDELDRLQIQLTLQYRQPLKKKHDSEKEVRRWTLGNGLNMFDF